MRILLLAATGAALIAAVDVRAAPPHDELHSNSHVWNGRIETGGHEHHPGCRHERHREHRYQGRYKGRHHGRYERSDRRGHHRARVVDQARWYARKSVDQAREARRLGVHFDHPRWSMSYNRHFEWALRADGYELEREIRRRARKLREIRSYGYARHGGVTVHPARPYGH
ncbi:MAG: hypothetical protein ACNS61_04095 [Candidatus Wenzhouxiangella sp. M2_3B_020]